MMQNSQTKRKKIIIIAITTIILFVSLVSGLLIVNHYNKKINKQPNEIEWDEQHDVYQLFNEQKVKYDKRLEIKSDYGVLNAVGDIIYADLVALTGYNEIEIDLTTHSTLTDTMGFDDDHLLDFIVLNKYNDTMPIQLCRVIYVNFRTSDSLEIFKTKYGMSMDSVVETMGEPSDKYEIDGTQSYVYDFERDDGLLFTVIVDFIDGKRTDVKVSYSDTIQN